MSVEFVDTNVLIYAHDRSARLKNAKSVNLLARLSDEESGALSTQVLSEFYSISTRKLRFSSEEAEEMVFDFGGWLIHRPAHVDLLRAAGLQRSFQISWWDALILN